MEQKLLLSAMIAKNYATYVKCINIQIYRIKEFRIKMNGVKFEYFRYNKCKEFRHIIKK
jgi:hypothetical protein